jgi:TRAP-type C4-dicarboxylate transport system permease small subunit
MAQITRIISGISFVLAALAGTALVVIALTIMLEVSMRALRIPLVGANEVVRVTFVASVYLAFSYVIVQRREIRVDVLRAFHSRTIQRLLDAAAGVITLGFFLLVAWFGFFRLQDNYARGVFLEGRLLIPMWIPWLTIVLGSAMSIVAALLIIVRSLAGLDDGNPGDETL